MQSEAMRSLSPGHQARSATLGLWGAPSCTPGGDANWMISSGRRFRHACVHECTYIHMFSDAHTCTQTIVISINPMMSQGQVGKEPSTSVEEKQSMTEKVQGSGQPPSQSRENSWSRQTRECSWWPTVNDWVIPGKTVDAWDTPGKGVDDGVTE